VTASEILLTTHSRLLLRMKSRIESLEILLSLYFEVLLGVRERTEERGSRAQRRRRPGRVRKRRRNEWGVIGLGVIVDGLKRGVEVGGFVVIAADNLVVVMARVVVRIIVAVFVVDTVVAGIHIMVRANLTRVIGIAGWKTDAAVMLSRVIGTLIKLRRRKCRGAHMRL